MAFSAVNLTSGFDATSGLTGTTASVSPSANARQFMAIYSFDTSDANVPDQASGIVSNGFTWSQLGTTTLSLFANSTYVTRLSLWSAPGIAAPTPGTAVITFPVNQGGIGWAWSEILTAGAIIQTVTNNNAAITTATQTSLTVTLAAFGNAANGAYVAFAQYGWNGDATVAPDTGWTELQEIFNGSVGGLETQWRASNDTTAVMTSSLGDWYGGIAVEFAVAVVSYTLTAAQGSFALNGQTAVPRVARVLTAAQGSVALGSQTVGLHAGFTIAGAQGSLALTGQAAALKTTRRLTAAQGSIALTGQAAGIRYGHVLGAGQVALALAGQAVTLTVTTASPVLTAAQGSVALTGQVAALKATRRLTASAGAFLFTGQSVALNLQTVYAAAHVLDFDVDGTGGTSITTPAITSQVSGSSFVASIGRLAVSSVAPTDSKGNTYAQVGTHHAYTLWPTSGTAAFVSLNADGGSGHTFSTAKPNNNETTLAVVEVVNGLKLQDQKWNEVLSGSPTTSLNVTTTGPACLISFWWGDGNLGTTHVANPSAGWTKVDSVSADTILIQCAVAIRNVGGAGTYNVTWTPQSPSTEGAQVWIIALQAGVAALAADPAALALAGQAAALHLTRYLATAQGSIALTGRAAGLQAARRLVAAQAAETLSGQAAGLKVTRRLTAAGGGLALTGEDAALTLVLGSTGHFTCTGQGAVLRAARGLLAVTANYTLTANAAVLQVTRRLLAAQAAVVLTGVAAGLTVQSTGGVLIAGIGNFSLTGFPVNLIYGSTVGNDIIATLTPASAPRASLTRKSNLRAALQRKI